NLNINSLSIKFAQINAGGSGNVSFSDPKSLPAKISFYIQPTELKGLEQFILPLSQHPLSGSIEAKASLDGDLKNTAQSKINISQLSVKNLATRIKYNTGDIFLDGPIAVNLTSKLSIDKLAVNSGSATVSANLSGLKIKHKDLF